MNMIKNVAMNLKTRASRFAANVNRLRKDRSGEGYLDMASALDNI